MRTNHFRYTRSHQAMSTIYFESLLINISRVLQQADKPLYVQPRMSQDPSKGSAIELLVIRHNHLCIGIVANKDDVATPLAHYRESRLLERSDTFSAAYNRQSAHKATTSRRSCGTGFPFSINTSVYRSIASFILASASFRLVPWLMQPGKVGHSATQYPSSPGYMITFRIAHRSILAAQLSSS